MDKREFISVSASENKDEKIKKEREEKDVLQQKKEEEKEKLFNTSYQSNLIEKRKIEKVSVVTSSNRNKRQTQFPSRCSLFGLTSMRESIMIKQQKGEFLIIIKISN
eukprot:TRINITY_DN14696_c0_g1_i1.p1 TRINITY_DN14696_c0_g1~~TRINITY_DN14696_c0_g1_i1.p1  ORF type:complete len:107 (+),score=23.09 TRINITY_DN14696_c0_g1_i1:131-451(+)